MGNDWLATLICYPPNATLIREYLSLATYERQPQHVMRPLSQKVTQRQAPCNTEDEMQ
jgi:hypothetical protein